MISGSPQVIIFRERVVTRPVCLGFSSSMPGVHVEMRLAPFPGSACVGDQKDGATLCGPAASMACSLSRCLCNAQNALCERHGVPQPPVLYSFDEMAAALQRAALLVAGEFDASFLTLDEWIVRWPEGKRLAIRESMLLEAPSPGRVKVMVKNEVYVGIPRRPRLIQFYRDFATQAATAPFVASLQHAVAKVFNSLEFYPGVFVTIACGMNASGIADWLADALAAGAVCFYESDGKDWDGTMGECHCRLRLDFYRLFDVAMADMLGQSVVVRACGLFPEGRLLYDLRGTVKSGHNDTTLGNSLVRVAIAADVFRRLGVPARIIVVGDDMFVAANAPVDCALARRFESEYGIKPSCRLFSSPYDGSFISGIWVTDGETVGFVPKPGRLLSRLWWSVNPPPESKMRAYQRGVAKGLIGACGDLPLIGPWLSSFIDEGPTLVSVKKHVVYKAVSFRFQRQGILEHFARRYSCTVRDLLDCETFLVSAGRQPSLLQHWLVQRVVDVDVADLDDRDEEQQ